MRVFLSLILATTAAFAFSFACDLLVGALVGVYPNTAYIPVVTWSVISFVALLAARAVASESRWLPLPYIFFGVLAGWGGLIGHRYDLVVAGVMFLHAYFVWRASSRRAAVPSKTELQLLKPRLANLTWNSDVSERLLHKARRQYPQKSEVEIYTYVIEQYENEHPKTP